MSQKTVKIIYWIFTGLLSLMMLFSAGMYFFNYEHIAEEFKELGHPLYIIYPLAIFKILGVIAITTRKVAVLTEWAYAGFFFNFLLAFSAHYAAQDDDQIGALLALTLLLGSYFFSKRLQS